MPIYECDPWREQYFVNVSCPDDVHIPTDDVDAYRFNSRYRWVYNKLMVAKTQSLECGLPDEMPLRYPVFSKPVVNLKGMGIGSCMINRPDEFKNKCPFGNFWTTYLAGDHVSSDFAVVNGSVLWCRNTLGIPAGGGTFDYWVVEASPRINLERYCRRWIANFMPTYTGMLNIESIGGRIIEAHLRFSDQWPDLYGEGWLEAVVRLYQYGTWDFKDSNRSDGYSIVLFGPHNRTYKHPDIYRQIAYRSAPSIKSVQITFLADNAFGLQAMPPGGFRLAIVNTQNSADGFFLRAVIANDFGLPMRDEENTEGRELAQSYA